MALRLCWAAVSNMCSTSSSERYDELQSCRGADHNERAPIWAEKIACVVCTRSDRSVMTALHLVRRPGGGTRRRWLRYEPAAFVALAGRTYCGYYSAHPLWSQTTRT
eukprot:TRINITY_DN1287_c0_g2_i1.p1 TRINITY_DN1287_c0_g2~~TRINITY_DN1287_c0_g2_i1.p1  ORF type:complete len:107 (+),score=3.97 TRINITY_DN1287_c0_g2_i1:34-354(+)